MIRAKILGTGAAVPKKILSNADLEKLVETSDDWIISRTGIRERHIVSDGEHFSDLCTRAGEQALKRAHVKAEDLDMILVGTISGDMPFPATSCLVQRNLGRSPARYRKSQDQGKKQGFATPTVASIGQLACTGR